MANPGRIVALLALLWLVSTGAGAQGAGPDAGSENAALDALDQASAALKAAEEAGQGSRPEEGAPQAAEQASSTDFAAKLDAAAAKAAADGKSQDDVATGDMPSAGATAAAIPPGEATAAAIPPAEHAAETPATVSAEAAVAVPPVQSSSSAAASAVAEPVSPSAVPAAGASAAGAAPVAAPKIGGTDGPMSADATVGTATAGTPAPVGVAATAPSAATAAAPEANASSNDGAPAALPAGNSVNGGEASAPSIPATAPPLLPGQISADAAATPVSLEQTMAVESELRATVKNIVMQYFKVVRMPPPDAVDVVATANLVNDANATATRLSGIAIDVHIVADYPDVVIAEARNYTQRELDGRGYRFDPATDDGDMRIPATLTFKAELPPPQTSWLAKRGWKPLAVLGGLVLLTLGLLILALAMTRRLFRGAPPPAAKQKKSSFGGNSGGRGPAVSDFSGSLNMPVVDFGLQSDAALAFTAPSSAAGQDVAVGSPASSRGPHSAYANAEIASATILRDAADREAQARQGAAAARAALQEETAALDAQLKEREEQARRVAAAVQGKERGMAAALPSPVKITSARETVSDLLRAGAQRATSDTEFSETEFSETEFGKANSSDTAVDDVLELPPNAPLDEVLPDTLVDDQGNLSVIGEPVAVRSGATARDLDPLEKPHSQPNAELAELFARIEQMPLDQAMIVLASLSEAERDLLFDRLNINSSVRRRVERELEDLRLGTEQAERP